MKDEGGRIKQIMKNDGGRMKNKISIQKKTPFIYPNGPLGGLAMAVLLAIGGIFGAFWLGLIFGLMRLSKRIWVKWPAVFFIEVIRGNP